jgi:hypothetical protein
MADWARCGRRDGQIGHRGLLLLLGSCRIIRVRDVNSDGDKTRDEDRVVLAIDVCRVPVHLSP